MQKFQFESYRKIFATLKNRSTKRAWIFYKNYEMFYFSKIYYIKFDTTF